MLILEPAAIDPVVRIANWLDCRPGARWGPRAEHDAELILVHAGGFRYRPLGRPWQAVAAREVLYIPAGVEHELELEPRCPRGGIACWHGELLPQGSWADGDYRLAFDPPTVTAVAEQPFLVAAFHDQAAVWQGYDPNRGLLLHDLARLVWLHLIALWQAGEDPGRNQRLEPMLAWLRERLHLPVGRNQLARAFGLTPQHINALFRRGLGVTPGAFVRRERILRAWHDLHAGGVGVTEAAARWGFSDPFHFSRVFRQVMGFPPSRAQGSRHR
jgi:AraC-like DNA-binding protein